MNTPLYFECHITIQPVFNIDLEILKEILAPKHKFKVANLILKKEARGEEIPATDDTFLTAHSNDFSELETRMRVMLDMLNDYRYSVLRYKIEAVILDSRSQGDIHEGIKQHKKEILEEPIQEFCCNPDEGVCCRHGDTTDFGHCGCSPHSK